MQVASYLPLLARLLTISQPLPLSWQSQPVQPTPLCIFTNIKSLTPMVSLPRVSSKVLVLEGFDCLELHVSGEVPCSVLTPVYFHVPSRNHPWDKNTVSLRLKNCPFAERSPRIIPYLGKDTLFALSKM